MLEQAPIRSEASETARHAHWLFFRKWVQSPLSVASIAPSSPDLSKAMAASLPDRDGIVVELGGGTGAVTQALLAQGLPLERIVIIERDAHFCAFLERRFPGIRVLQGDAGSLKFLLRGANVALPVSAVISGLPFVSMPNRLQVRLLHQAFAVTGGKGPFIQFSYSPLSPLKRCVRDRMGVIEQCTQQVWRNLPPAKVWCFYGAGIKASPGPRPRLLLEGQSQTG